MLLYFSENIFLKFCHSFLQEKKENKQKQKRMVDQKTNQNNGRQMQNKPSHLAFLVLSQTIAQLLRPNGLLANTIHTSQSLHSC